MMQRILHTSTRHLRASSTVRCFSTSLPDIDASKLSIEKTGTPKTKLPKEQLKFGSTYTDHMLEVDWTSEKGWKTPRISAYHSLSIDPAASVLHYALECFEGMKAYVDDKKQVRLFRPELNMQRLHDSMVRLNLPGFDKEQYLQCIKELVLLDRDWIPSGDGYSLYLRPTGISTHPFLGVGPAHSAKMFTIMSPVGPYYPEGFAPVKLYADRQHVRAWPGGTGDKKVGGNYGPTIRPQILAAQRGYSQVLWLADGEGGPFVTEVGTMNFFVFWTNKDGEKELVSPALDGTILPGVTRRSVLDLAREAGEYKVTERAISIHELLDALREGRLHEAFGTGTAVVVSPIKCIHYDGQDYDVPIDVERGAGPLTQWMWDNITGIQTGKIERPDWSIVL